MTVRPRRDQRKVIRSAFGMLPTERPRELQARVALALIRLDYKKQPDRYAHPPSGVLLRAIELRDGGQGHYCYPLLYSLSVHLAQGMTSGDWGYLWVVADTEPLRARWKQRMGY